jgi:hypothetical protein
VCDRCDVHMARLGPTVPPSLLAHTLMVGDRVVILLVQCMSPFLCRFSDACMTTRSAGADGRRRKSAKARNRGRRSACGAARYGELSSRRIVRMADFGRVIVRADLGGGVGGCLWRAGKRAEPCLLVGMREV